MGLPRYEKPADPDWMVKRQSSVMSSTYDNSITNDTSNGRGIRSSKAISEANDDGDDEDDVLVSPIANGTSVSRDKFPPKLPPSDDEAEPTTSKGMMGKLKGMGMGKKKQSAPPKPVDTRRRRYNQTFGKKAGFGQEGYGNEDGEEEEMEEEEEEQQEVSPQQDRVRTSKAIQNGRAKEAGLAGAGVIGGAAAAGGVLGSHAKTADEVKSAVQARDREPQAAPVLAPSGLAVAGGEGDGASSVDEEELQDAPQGEPADVHDNDSVAAIINSSSFAPSLTGGYLDEKVPTYDLIDPSKKDSKSPVEKDDGYPDEKKSNGYGKKAAGVGAAGLFGSGLLASREEEKHHDDPHADEEQGEEEPAPVATKAKASRPPKSPMRDSFAKKREANSIAAAGAGAGGLVAEEEQEEEESRTRGRKAAAAPRKEAAAKRPKIAPLTVIQRHYLLKALVSIQMQQEFTELEKLGALTLYGYPFSLERPKLKRIKDKHLEGDFAQGDFEEEADDPYADADEDEIRKRENLSEPLICRHMFHAHLQSFPGLDTAPAKYWQKRIQPFFDEMAARNFSTSIERAETTSRRFYTLAMTRYLGGFFSRGFGVRGEGELRGPGKGAPGTDRWGKGKEWGKGTVKRGLDRPARPDEQMYAKIDGLFEGQEGEVWKRARKETTRIKRDWQGFKQYVIERESGLEETMNYLDVGNLRNLPPQYRNAEEYARFHAAYIFHTLFVTSPSADSFYSVLKGIHLLFPYWGAKQLLKVANAQTMIQGILNLLLARPAGAKSLVQRIFVSVIGGQASTINKENVGPLRKAIGEPELCNKIEEYVKRGSRPEGKAIRNRAIRTGQDVVATVLLYSSGTELGSNKKDEVLDMHDAFAQSPFRGQLNSAYPPTTPVGKAGNEPRIDNWGVDPVEEGMARKYAMLKLFLREVLKRRDREEACKMASGSLVPSIIKESLDTVFYGPIKKIAEVSDLSARLGDLQAFFDDIIKTKKAGDDSMPAWIALTARHENSLYFLFHECSAIVKPFTEWLQKGADYMALSTTDPAHPANRRAKNIEVNLEELLRDGRLTDDDVTEILAEVDQLANYVKWQKVWYELEMRKNFLLARSDAIPASGLNEEDIPKNGNMKSRISDVDGLLRELMEQEGVEIEEGVVENDARGTEMRDFPWAWFDAVDPLHQHLENTNPNDLRFTPNVASIKMPTIKATRKALDPFRQTLIEKMPAWKEGDARVSLL